MKIKEELNGDESRLMPYKKLPKEEYNMIKFCDVCGQGYLPDICHIPIIYPKINWKYTDVGICDECKKRKKRKHGKKKAK